MKAYIIIREIKHHIAYRPGFLAMVNKAELGRIIMYYNALCALGSRFLRSPLGSGDEAALGAAIAESQRNLVVMVLSVEHLSVCVRDPHRWLHLLYEERQECIRDVLKAVGMQARLDEHHAVVVDSRQNVNWHLLSRLVSLHRVLRNTKLGHELQGSPYLPNA